MTINESIFNNNNALNGGVIYLNIIKNDNKTIKNQNKNDVEIMNSLFIENKAEKFGGAIYSDFINMNIFNITNSSFVENNAYAGGAIYINDFDDVDDDDNNNKENLLSNYEDFFNDIKFINNTSDSHGDDYASKPYKINLISPQSEKLMIRNGDHISMDFNLIDMFNQTIQDVSKYYSNIMLNMVYDSNIYNNIKVVGNGCIFSRGIKIFFIYLKIFNKY